VLGDSVRIHGRDRANPRPVEKRDAREPGVEPTHADAVPAMRGELLLHGWVGERRPHGLLARQGQLRVTTSVQEQAK
jgi:hypothetical protein